MLPELLPYKYLKLQFSDQYDDNARTQLGWKARKYAKWTQVHVEDDRELLKSFADNAIDEGVLIEDLFYRVNEILLNVQKWRLDKENFSIEPEHTKNWDRASSLIEGANEEPALMPSYLQDYGIDIHNLSDKEIYRAFHNHVLSDLILTVRGNGKKLTQSVVVTSDQQTLLEEIKRLVPQAKELQRVDKENLLDAFGLASLTYSEKPLPRDKLTQQFTSFSFDKLPNTELFKVNAQIDLVSICINSNNAFVNHMREGKDTEFILKSLVKVMHQVREKRIVNSKQINDFMKHLTVGLDETFDGWEDDDFD